MTVALGWDDTWVRNSGNVSERSSARMRKLFVVLMIAATASANEISYRSLQSFTTATPLHDRGLHGEGQIVAVLDTGLDYRLGAGGCLGVAAFGVFSGADGQRDGR